MISAEAVYGPTSVAALRHVLGLSQQDNLSSYLRTYYPGALTTNQSAVARGERLSLYLRKMRDDIPTYVPKMHSASSVLETHVKTVGASLEEAFHFPLLLGSTTSTGYERVDTKKTLVFPEDHVSHIEHRIDTWCWQGQVTTTSSQTFTFSLVFIRKSQHPNKYVDEEMVRVDPDMYKVFFSFQDGTTTTLKNNGPTIPSGVGLTQIQNKPFRLSVGDAYVVQSTTEDLFPMTLDAADIDNGVNVELILSEPDTVGLPIATAYSRGYCIPSITCHGEITYQGVTTPLVGSQNVISMQHIWETSLTHPGYEKSVIVRSLDVIPQHLNQKPMFPKTNQWLSVFVADVLTRWTLHVVALKTSELKTETVFPVKMQATRMAPHKETLGYKDANLIVLSWQTSPLTQIAYPRVMTCLNPSNTISLEIVLETPIWHNMIDMVPETQQERGLKPVLDFVQCYAKITGTLPNEMELDTYGWVYMSSRQNEDQQNVQVMGAMGISPSQLQTFRWHRPSSGEAAGSFFVWCVPIFIVLLLIVVIVFACIFRYNIDEKP